MKKLLVILCVMFLVFWMNGFLEASTILSFEDLYHAGESPSVHPMPKGYAGFNWSSSILSNDKLPSADGYVYGTIGRTSIITTNNGASMSKDDGYFDFIGAYISDAFYGGTATVVGLKNNSPLYSRTVSITEPKDEWAPLNYFAFNFTGVDTIKFSSPETHIVIDNIYLDNVTAAVPIPGAVWLLGSGLIGFIGIKKKFKK